MDTIDSIARDLDSRELGTQDTHARTRFSDGHGELSTVRSLALEMTPGLPVESLRALLSHLYERSYARNTNRGYQQLHLETTDKEGQPISILPDALAGLFTRYDRDADRKYRDKVDQLMLDLCRLLAIRYGQSTSEKRTSIEGRTWFLQDAAVFLHSQGDTADAARALLAFEHLMWGTSHVLELLPQRLRREIDSGAERPRPVINSEQVSQLIRARRGEWLTDREGAGWADYTARLHEQEKAAGRQRWEAYIERHGSVPDAEALYEHEAEFFGTEVSVRVGEIYFLRSEHEGHRVETFEIFDTHSQVEAAQVVQFFLDAVRAKKHAYLISHGDHNDREDIKWQEENPPTDHIALTMKGQQPKRIPRQQLHRYLGNYRLTDLLNLAKALHPQRVILLGGNHERDPREISHEGTTTQSLAAGSGITAVEARQTPEYQSYDRCYQSLGGMGICARVDAADARHSFARLYVHAMPPFADTGSAYVYPHLNQINEPKVDLQRGVFFDLEDLVQLLQIDMPDLKQSITNSRQTLFEWRLKQATEYLIGILRLRTEAQLLTKIRSVGGSWAQIADVGAHIGGYVGTPGDFTRHNFATLVSQLDSTRAAEATKHLNELIQSEAQEYQKWCEKSMITRRQQAHTLLHWGDPIGRQPANRGSADYDALDRPSGSTRSSGRPGMSRTALTISLKAMFGNLAKQTVVHRGHETQEEGGRAHRLDGQVRTAHSMSWDRVQAVWVYEQPGVPAPGCQVLALDKPPAAEVKAARALEGHMLSPAHIEENLKIEGDIELFWKGVELNLYRLIEAYTKDRTLAKWEVRLRELADQMAGKYVQVFEVSRYEALSRAAGVHDSINQGLDHGELRAVALESSDLVPLWNWLDASLAAKSQDPFLSPGGLTDLKDGIEVANQRFQMVFHLEGQWWRVVARQKYGDQHEGQLRCVPFDFRTMQASEPGKAADRVRSHSWSYFDCEEGCLGVNCQRAGASNARPARHFVAKKGGVPKMFDLSDSEGLSLFMVASRAQPRDWKKASVLPI